MLSRNDRAALFSLDIQLSYKLEYIAIFWTHLNKWSPSTALLILIWLWARTLILFFQRRNSECCRVIITSMNNCEKGRETETEEWMKKKRVGGKRKQPNEFYKFQLYCWCRLRNNLWNSFTRLEPFPRLWLSRQWDTTYTIII